MNILVLHIGSNKDNRIASLTRARLLLSEEVGIIKRASAIYETAPWGKTDQEAFLNQALLIESIEKDPQLILENCLSIEYKMGRERKGKWGPRVIDIDIIFYNDVKVSSENLQIPHLHYKERRFVLKPLEDIIPNYIPVDSDLSINQLLEVCKDQGSVRLF